MFFIHLHTSVLEITSTEFRSLASSSYKNNTITLLSLFLCGRRSSWRGPQISQRLCTASHVTTTRSRPSATRPLTEEWWESTPSAVSSPSTSQRPHKVYGMKVSMYISINPAVKSLNQTKVVYWPNWRLVSLRANHQSPSRQPNHHSQIREPTKYFYLFICKYQNELYTFLEKCLQQLANISELLAAWIMAQAGYSFIFP